MRFESLVDDGFDRIEVVGCGARRLLVLRGLVSGGMHCVSGKLLINLSHLCLEGHLHSGYLGLHLCEFGGDLLVLAGLGQSRLN